MWTCATSSGLIHEISGLNVVVDPGVKGNLTIVLDDVPWDQALDIVLKNNDLDKQLDGNVLRLATKETLRKEAEENRDLAKAAGRSSRRHHDDSRPQLCEVDRHGHHTQEIPLVSRATLSRTTAPIR